MSYKSSGMFLGVLRDGSDSPVVVKKFEPTIYEFDLSDNGNPYNITISKLGTPIPTSNSLHVDRPTSYISERSSTFSGGVIYCQKVQQAATEIYGYAYDPYFYSPNDPNYPYAHWAERYTYGLWDTAKYSGGMYFGAAYIEETDESFMFVSMKKSDDSFTTSANKNVSAGSGTFWDSINVEDYKNFVKRLFYGYNDQGELPKNLIISPTLQYLSKGNSIQFKAELEYESRKVDVTSKVNWGLSESTIDDAVKELNGYSISDDGILTSINPSVPKITVSAKIGNLGEYTTVFTSNYEGIYSEGGFTGGQSGNTSSGGNGVFGKNETSDIIESPTTSASGDASSTGMFTRYLVNSSYLDIVGDWLWNTDLGLTIAKSVISLIYGNPAESVISLMAYPFDIRQLQGVSTRNQNLYWGNHNSGLPFIALTSSSALIDWGTININEYWGNFLDYEPHTKIEMYLPWGTGFVSIDPNYCMNGNINVKTLIDLSKGSCIHNVVGNGNVIATYAGQCSQQIPILSNDYASKIAGVVTAAAGLAIAGGAGMGGTMAGDKASVSAIRNFDVSKGLGQIDEAVSTASSPHAQAQKTGGKLAASSSIAAFKRSGIIARNGAFTDGSAALGVQYPYIILSRPKQSVPREYGSHYGYPSNIYASLAQLRGYTEVGEIHLYGIRGTDAEVEELDSILKGGVIF